MSITRTGARVVALWGLFNAVLVAVLFGFGELAPVLAMAASMVGLVFVIAAVVRAREPREQERNRWREEANGDSVLLFALAVLIAGLGLAFYPYLAILAVAPLTAAALRELSARRGGLQK